MLSLTDPSPDVEDGRGQLGAALSAITRPLPAPPPPPASPQSHQLAKYQRKRKKAFQKVRGHRTRWKPSLSFDCELITHHSTVFAKEL